MAGTQFWGVGRLGTTQHVAYTGTAGEITNAVGSESYKVMIVVTTDAFVRIAQAGDTATGSDAYVVGLVPSTFTITPGQKVSAMQVSSGGTLYVTELG